MRRWIMRNPTLSQDAAKAMGRVAENGASSAVQKIGLLSVINDVMSAQRVKQRGYQFGAVVLPRILTFLSAASVGDAPLPERTLEAAAAAAAAANIAACASPRASGGGSAAKRAKRPKTTSASDCRAAVNRILRNWRKQGFFDGGVLDELEGFMVQQEQAPPATKGLSSAADSEGGVEGSLSGASTGWSIQGWEQAAATQLSESSEEQQHQQRQHGVSDFASAACEVGWRGGRADDAGREGPWSGHSRASPQHFQSHRQRPDDDHDRARGGRGCSQSQQWRELAWGAPRARGEGRWEGRSGEQSSGYRGGTAGQQRSEFSVTNMHNGERRHSEEWARSRRAPHPDGSCTRSPHGRRGSRKRARAEQSDADAVRTDCEQQPAVDTT